MPVLITILCVLTGAAGWYYLFYSGAAVELADWENKQLNAWRVLLRRIGGGIMLALAVALYLGFQAAMEPVRTAVFVSAWSAVIILLASLVALAIIDVLFTVRLRKRHNPRHLRGTPLDRNDPPT